MKFKNFLEEYQTREQHFNVVVKRKDIEYALLEAKYDVLELQNKTALDALNKSKIRNDMLNTLNTTYTQKLTEAEEKLVYKC